MLLPSALLLLEVESLYMMSILSDLATVLGRISLPNFLQDIMRPLVVLEQDVPIIKAAKVQGHGAASASSGRIVPQADVVIHRNSQEEKRSLQTT